MRVFLPSRTIETQLRPTWLFSSLFTQTFIISVMALTSWDEYEAANSAFQEVQTFQYYYRIYLNHIS